MEEEPASEASVQDLIADQLDHAHLSERAADFVLAALLGEDELAAAVSGTDEAERAPAPASADAPAAAPALYLRSIIVEGFRGIGSQAALRLLPGPGLTIVAGRNGSGKSSFAEAAELALTGDNKRWSGRTAVWRDGWRNLHSPDVSSIQVDLTADGQPGIFRVTRHWSPGADLDTAQSVIQAHGQRQQPLATADWARQIELFRPFLSYSELGALVSGKPSDMYDAVQAILGLDQLVGAEKRLDAERKKLDEPSRLATRTLPVVRKRLAASSDQRARDAEKALSTKPRNLEAVEALAVGAGAGADPRAARLAQIADIELTSDDAVTVAVERLRAAAQAVAELANTPADDARRLARLLRTAIEHQTSHPDESCPVCGGRALDDAWLTHAQSEETRLQALARTADDAHKSLAVATKAAGGLLGSAPRVLAEDLPDGLEATAVRTAWQSWTELTSSVPPDQLIPALPAAIAAVRKAVTELQTAAAAALKRRNEAWQPVAAALASWVEQARSSDRAAANLAEVKTGLAWLRAAGQEIRDARMAPFTTMSAGVWNMLRQESNVDLGPIRLTGAATRRSLSLDITVDGVEGAALSVMSQGELHALGLALFLPRATAPNSPFRFIVIDDPVQAMDPAKVDGLARLLSQVGKDRQVVVFTHDDRLPEAIRRLQLPATIWEVIRKENSVVELTKNEDPVDRYIEDARAMARTEELSEDSRRAVVAGYCRSALEAACQEAVRARRINAGARHADVEQELTRATTLRMLVALALLKDAARGKEVDAELRKRFGQAGVNALAAANAGTHGAYQGQLKRLVDDVERVAAGLCS
jgi:AAA domain